MTNAKIRRNAARYAAQEASRFARKFGGMQTEYLADRYHCETEFAQAERDPVYAAMYQARADACAEIIARRMCVA